MDHHVLTPLPGGHQLPRCWRGHPQSPAQLAAAVDRFLALRDFRSRLYGCLTLRADALFELADAVLCADHAVTSLVQLCLEPEFTRGHGALYDALSAGRIDDERLFSLLASELPQAVDGPEARAWIAEHDVIDHGLLETGAGRAAPGRCRAGAGRVRPVGPAAVRRRRDRLPQAGRVVLPGPGARAQRRLPLQGLQQDRARLGVPVHRGHRAPAHRVGRPARRGADHARDPDGADDRAGEERAAPPARRRARREGRAAVRLRRRLQRRRPHRRAGLGCPVHVLVRLAAGSVFYAEPVTWEGKYGRPARRGAAVHCLEPADFAAPTPGSGPAGPEEAPAPEPRTRRGAHPARYPALRHRPRRGLARRAPPHPRRPRLVRRPEEPAGPARHPRPRHRRAAARRPRPAPGHVAVARRPRPAVPRRALARLPRQVRHRARDPHPQGHPRPHRREGQGPRAGRPLGPAPHGRARPAPARPAPGRRPPPPLGETARPRPAAGTGPGPPRVSQHPPRPGDTRPCRETLPPRARQAQRKQQRPSTPLPAPRLGFEHRAVWYGANDAIAR